MPPGSKAKYTNKQKRKAEHIEESYEKRGVKKGEAEERAWRTVNKQDGGGKKKATGRTSQSNSRSKTPSRTGAKKTARRPAKKRTAKAR